VSDSGAASARRRESQFFLRGTLLPARRASDRPMAIACLRLRTFRPERPLLSCPRFISCIARRTFWPLALLYLRAMVVSSEVTPR
jgi:hypothetical protein